jgi:uncharacterized protein
MFVWAVVLFKKRCKKERMSMKSQETQKFIAWLHSAAFVKNIKNFPFVKKVVLFGSRARGDNAQRSDIDIAVFCPHATIQDWFKILECIDQADTLLPIDCVHFEKVDSELQQKITKEGVEL